MGGLLAASRAIVIPGLTGVSYRLRPDRVGSNGRPSPRSPALVPPQSSCLATKLPLFLAAKAVARRVSPSRCLRIENMRKIVLVAAIAGAALSLAACSENTEEAAGEAADSAMADA